MSESTTMIEQAEAGTKLRLEFPPIPTPKEITEGKIDTAVKDAIREAEEQRDTFSSETEIKLTPTSNALVESANATTISRLIKLVPDRMKLALRQSASKAALTVYALSYLISSGCGNKGGAEVQYIEPTQTPPPAAVREIPTGMPSEVEFQRLVTATPEQPSISAPTPEPTPASSPTPTIEPTPTSAPNPTENETIQKENRELIPYSPSITIIDAAPSVPTKGLIQKEFISNDEMIKKMLGDKYVSKEQIIQEFGQNYEEKWDEVVDKYPQAFVYRLANRYFSHGENVARVAEDTLERSGLESTGINMLPLQKIFDKDSVTFIKDSSGNPGVSLNFDPKRIIKLLENDQNRVINGSFQVGNVELFQETSKYTDVIPKYDPNDPRFTSLFGDAKGNNYPGAVSYHTNPDGSIDFLDAEGKSVSPISSEELQKRKLENSEVKEWKVTSLLPIVGAYTKEKAMENLPKLFEVCNAYPDKFFVFAGGNGGEDFREAMIALTDKVPKNLLITAEWVKNEAYEYQGPPLYSYDGKFHGGVWGPDIYVNNGELGAPGGSSFSVPIISAEIDALLNKGLSFEQVKEKILTSSDTHPKTLADGTEVTLRVFNPPKIQGR